MINKKSTTPFAYPCFKKMARLIKGPTIHTPSEWHSSNQTNYLRAEQERTHGELIRDESKRLIDETEITTQKTQSDVNKKIDQRLDDISFWKNELCRQHKETEDEIQRMLSHKERLERALAATQLPLRIATDCIRNRENRVAIDLVHDDVEIQLLKEVEVIRGVQALLNKTLGKATEQVRLLRSANYHLNKDTTDKMAALRIDGVCSEITNETTHKYYAENCTKVSENSATPQQWECFSNKNVVKAEDERNRSITMRSMIDEILEETYQDQEKQHKCVNLAFHKRIEETETAKNRLENHLSKVDKEISEMQENIQSLKRSIYNKSSPMQVPHTRLDTRAQRPNMELCSDHVEEKLISEVHEISHNILKLTKMLENSDESLRDLKRQKLNLEEDIEVKTTTLQVDRDHNVVLRQNIHHKHY